MISQKVNKIMLAALIFGLLSAFVMPISAFAYNKSWDQGHKCVQGLPGASGWGRYGYDTTSPNDYRGGEYPTKECCQQYCRLCPVYGNTGRLQKTFSDLTVPGIGPSLTITRTYLSQDWANTLFGRGWIFKFGKKLVVTRDGNGEKILIVRRNTGEQNFFKEHLDGTIERLAYYGLPYKLIKNSDGTYSIANQDGSIQLLNSNGKTIQIADKNGNKLLFTYNSVGCLSRITNASGNYVDFVLGVNGKVASISDNLGRTVKYLYDTNSNLISVTDPMGNVSQYAYDSQNRMISLTDPRGNTVFSVTYDSFEPSRIATFIEKGETWTFTYYDGYTVKQDSSGHTWTYYYNDVGIIEKIVDPLGNKTQQFYNYVTSTSMEWKEDANGNRTTYTYDNDGNIVGKTDPLGNVWIYSYIAETNLFETVTNPLGVVTKYEYDTNGDLIKLIKDSGGPLESTTRYTYDSNGRQTSLTDPLGNTSSYEYDNAGNLIKHIDPLGNERTYTYDNRGNRLTYTDPAGNQSTYQYNMLDQIVSVTNALGHTMRYSYDANGNRIKIQLPNGQQTISEFDAYNRLVKYIDPGGKIFNYAYDHNDKLVSQVDANGNITQYGYDILGRRISVTNAENHQTVYSYDAVGNLLSFTDAKGNTTTFTYDALNRQTQKIYPDGASYTYTYDALGRNSRQTDANGNTIFYVYDRFNRLAQKQFPDGSSEDYTFDLMGRIISGNNAHSALSYSYDALGRIVSSTQNGKTIHYGYDTVGNRTSLTTPEGETLTYVYDAVNYMVRLQLSSGKGIAYTYDSLGRIVSKDYSGGANAILSFNQAGQLANLSYQLSDGTQVYTQSNIYDSVGNLVQKNSNGINTSYSYDRLYQLLDVDYPVATDEHFSYDPVRNRLTTSEYTDWVHNNRNELQGFNGVSYSYDQNGNTISKVTSSGSTIFQSNFENRLVQVNLSNGSHATYKYDVSGRRVEKNVDGVVTKYLYSGNTLLAEYNDTDNLQRNYFYGVGDYNPSILYQNQQVYFYVNDHLGTPQQIVNENGHVEWEAEYSSFGSANLTVNTIQNNVRFAGQHFDQETGLHYNGHRYFDPEIGRYLSVDPIGIRGGINFFVYTANNPINLIDPLGLCWSNARAVAHYENLFSGDVTLAETGCVGRVSTATLSDRNNWKAEVKIKAETDAKAFFCPGGGSELVNYHKYDHPHSGVWWIGGMTLTNRAVCNVVKNCRGCKWSYFCTITNSMNDRFENPFDFDNSNSDWWDDIEIGRPFFVTHTWIDTVRDSGGL